MFFILAKPDRTELEILFGDNKEQPSKQQSHDMYRYILEAEITHSLFKLVRFECQYNCRIVLQSHVARALSLRLRGLW